MTKHVIAQYHDNFTLVPYCKICSAEGDNLQEECSGKPAVPKKYIDPQKIIDDF